LDPHGAEGTGNPIGGLVFSNVWGDKTGLGQQIHEWTNFMSDSEYCIRVCKEGPQAATWCQHVYDINGCRWNMPANYDAGFETCQGDSGIPMGLYPQEDGSTSTYQPRATPVPDAHPAPASSGCQTFESTVISNGVPIQTITATTFSTSVRSITTRIGSTSSTVVTPSQSSSLPRPSSSSPAPTSNNSNANNSNGTVGQSISLVSILVGGVLALCTLF
ncbi:hypothetical protein FRC15_011651, partial [Serendipita sp. 397]